MEQLRLGEFIAKLEKLIKDEDGKDNDIRFDFVNFYPNDISSYRGYYDQLALHYSNEYLGDDGVTVAKVLQFCKAAIRATFQGWKGGDYLMSEDTLLWVANPGETGSTAVVDVVADYRGVIIKTEIIE